MNYRGMEGSRELLLAGEELAATPPAARVKPKEAPGDGQGVVSALLALVTGRGLDYYGIGLLLAVWELAPRLGLIDMQFFQPPHGHGAGGGQAGRLG